MSGSDIALYVIVVLAWGSSWIGLKLQAGGSVAPEVSVLWRMLIACPLMFLWAWVAGHPLRFGLRSHMLFAAMGAAMFSLNYALFYVSSLSIPSGLLAVIFSLASIYSVVLGALVFHTRIEPRMVLAGCIGVCGLAAMFAPEIMTQDLDVAAALALGQGLLATALFCLGSIASAVSQQRGQPVLSASAWGMLYGCAILAALGLVRGHAFTMEWSVMYLGSLVWLAVVASVVAFWAYLTLVGRMGAGRAGYSTVLFPVVALALSTVFEDFRWTALAALGLVLVLAGNVLVLSGQRR